MSKITREAKKIIENNPVAFGTVDRFSRPNVIGVAFIKVVGENTVLITDNFMKQTKKNLAINKNVCLAVWNKKWQGYKLVGRARYYVSGKWKKFVEEMPENKGLPAKGAILITVSQIIKLG
ncbi:MAG: pyridoxamine 5'-phosphate oxidase family protein [Patescibacteria group bacterium]|nr:pyridoxamine 5'-phosphate oxidase family protein [Patescibacteria group bacterium]MDD5490655.1 pyridoxamine 5'-phosphate oxidase family protein [Patescibacteria group bacterium]